MSIYTECVAAGVPVANHYSDLYIPANDTTRAILKKHDSNACLFVNQVEGGMWYDVPFAFDPYWQSTAGGGL